MYQSEISLVLIDIVSARLVPRFYNRCGQRAKPPVLARHSLGPAWHGLADARPNPPLPQQDPALAIPLHHRRLWPTSIICSHLPHPPRSPIPYEPSMTWMVSHMRAKHVSLSRSWCAMLVQAFDKTGHAQHGLSCYVPCWATYLKCRTVSGMAHLFSCRAWHDSRGTGPAQLGPLATSTL